MEVWKYSKLDITFEERRNLSARGTRIQKLCTKIWKHRRLGRCTSQNISSGRPKLNVPITFVQLWTQQKEKWKKGGKRNQILKEMMEVLPKSAEQIKNHIDWQALLK